MSALKRLPGFSSTSGSLAGAAEVLIGAGINLDDLAHRDEEGHGDHCAGFQGRRFLSTT